MNGHAHETDDGELLRAVGIDARALGDAARGADVEIPAPVDAAIRAAARSRARAIRARRRRILALPLSIGGIAAAAAVLLAVGLSHGTGAPREPAAERPVAEVPTPMDIDRSGYIDIVDAYLMSRRLGSPDGAPPAWDFDGSGRVDDADLKAVALAAVSL